MINKNRYLFMILYFISIFTLSHGFTKAKKNIPLSSYIYGITVDDSWEGKIKTEEIIAAIKAMDVKPTVRIVMSKETPPEKYRKLFEKIHKVAYIMATPVDSYDMKKYNVSAYLKRFVDSYEALSEYTDLWEIGNEINGENWLGKNPELISGKAYAAFRYISGNNAKTVLTSYYSAPREQQIPMDKWLIKYIPDDMKKNLDYVLVSYYEDDNNGYQPDWKKIFNNLETIFPNSKLGIGECGNTRKGATTESKIKMIRHYYTMPKYVKNYIGGYFWWYWVQDSVPHEKNKVWEEINKSMKSI
ncbi:MAG: hypothetical protein Q4D53_06450 [Leptotrichiaceae bacterium]|nr:hypothetical protein [Leptotrichiaceae bacterium]